MISEKMQAAINNQINAEIYSAYLYFSMAAYFRDLNLDGFAHWMQVQAQEELCHALIFNNFMADRGGRILMQPIAGPPTEWNGPDGPFKDAYDHELTVTQRIHNLVSLAAEEKDYASITFLDWFVKEQVEEEAAADKIVRQLRLVGDDKSGLFMIDRELATRVFVLPAPLAAGGA